MGSLCADHNPTCSVSHRLINSLTVIVGNCDILRENAGQSWESDAQILKRLAVIREVAMELVNEVKDHAGDLDSPVEASPGNQEAEPAGEQAYNEVGFFVT